jgi:DNA-binding FadR family transcriptional regulator
MRELGELAIHRKSPMPFYFQLAEPLEQQIARGRWQAGTRLPAEREVCERYRLPRRRIRLELRRGDDSVDARAISPARRRGRPLRRQSPAGRLVGAALAITPDLASAQIAREARFRARHRAPAKHSIRPAQPER